MKFSLTEVDSSWHDFFEIHIDQLNEILENLVGTDFTPERENIFRVFRTPLQEVRVVMFGQDPYPGKEVADGLAFSCRAGTPIPASLRNIFKEYVSDLSLASPTSADLSSWSAQGVLLLNRSLTTVVGERNAHLGLRWQEFTLAVAKYLAQRQVVAILWGAYARELAPYFPHVIESPHPSPLSAHRGFFGSRPFSQANDLLLKIGREPIDWKLQ
jgi:uracil-DNA glycosylase